ncbi:unnamed protein product [Pseudo-nitzschia multistriata]|uniref:Uncharacterized protein n=1 Tax=Pseudo-nitzschia multistriata TaxID=183589 RepID=A0A448Z780_9STRA|nr:unnamed protein product [Pseudo-nitzschia multistriata]
MQYISKRHYNHLTWNAERSETNLFEWDSAASLVEHEAARLVDRLSLDAVEASQKAAIQIIQIVEYLDIPRELFGRHWEEDLTNNEVAKYIVTVFGNYLSDVKDSLVSQYLYHKVVVALVRCTVCFYIKRFILKADRVRYSIRQRRNRMKSQEFFSNPRRAQMRMTHDIEVFQKFFLDVSDGSKILQKIVADEFSVLDQLLLECSIYALSRCGFENLEEFIIVVYKRSGAHADVTRHLLSDIFLLMNGEDKDRCVRKTIQNLNEDLDKIKERIVERRNEHPSVQTAKANAAYFCLEEMLEASYNERIIQENMALCAGVGKDIIELRKQITGSKKIH